MTAAPLKKDPMPLLLDHLVIHVTDLEATIADYQTLGFTVQRGGTHAEGVTHNALVGFSDGSYLELIAFLKPGSSHRWAAAQQSGIEGFIDFALLPDSVPAVIAAARERGLVYQGPFDGGRLRPDGERLVWQTGTPPSADLPFLCGDVTPRALRVREGEVRVHANGVRGVAQVNVAVNDLEASLARYTALLGPQLSAAVRPASLTGLGLRQALLPLGPTTLSLVAPGPQGLATETLRGHLQTRGEGVIGVTLRGPAAKGAAAEALSPQLRHGAAFEIQPG